jgi:hypothetical protein
MNVYQKLNEARDEFHQAKLKKSGHNKFANYYYFELGDFVIPALEIFKQIGLTSIISFGKEEASMTIVNNDKPEEKIVLTSPMSSAALKGCHEVQNLGAVQTYLRRYLWVAALEIVEHDALDGTVGSDKKTIKPTDGVIVSKDRQNIIADVAIAIADRINADDLIGAYEEYRGITDDEEKVALWALLPSNVRSALKKHGETLKGLKG